MGGHDPRPSATRLEYGDSLLLLGHNSNLERLERNPNLILKSMGETTNLGADNGARRMSFWGRTPGTRIREATILSGNGASLKVLCPRVGHG